MDRPCELYLSAPVVYCGEVHRKNVVKLDRVNRHTCETSLIDGPRSIWVGWHDGWGKLMTTIHTGCATRLCEHINIADHIPLSTTQAIHHGAIHYLVSVGDHTMKEVNYIDRLYATLDLANRYA